MHVNAKVYLLDEISLLFEAHAAGDGLQFPMQKKPCGDLQRRSSRRAVSTLFIVLFSEVSSNTVTRFCDHVCHGLHLSANSPSGLSVPPLHFSASRPFLHLSASSPPVHLSVASAVCGRRPSRPTSVVPLLVYMSGTNRARSAQGLKPTAHFHTATAAAAAAAARRRGRGAGRAQCSPVARCTAEGDNGSAHRAPRAGGDLWAPASRIISGDTGGTRRDAGRGSTAGQPAAHRLLATGGVS